MASRYTIGDVTVIGTGQRIYSVYLDGKAPLQGGGANGVPLGMLLGRVWQTSDGTWAASPYHNSRTGQAWQSWDAERAGASVGFRTRREACVYLHGMRTARVSASRNG